MTEAARVVLGRLCARGETLGVAESCTGGLLGATVTAVPGASKAFRGGVVAYHNDVKERLLGVDAGLLARDGSVSESVAIAMARGARACLDSVWGIAITGVAGPGGGSRAKPVGTVWIALAGPPGERAEHWHLAGDRETVRRGAVRRALEWLAEELGARS